MAIATHNTAADLGLVERFAVTFKTLTTRYARYKLYRATLNEMAVLSDRELRDLGLHRSQIKSIAREHVYDVH